MQNHELAQELDGGSLAIFRLAPQDYHRFHIPTSGTIVSIESIQGTYYTGKIIDIQMIHTHLVRSQSLCCE